MHLLLYFFTTLFLALLLSGTGKILCRFCPPLSDYSPGLQLCIHFTLGCLFWTAYLFTLAALKFLTPWTILIPAGITGIYSLFRIKEFLPALSGFPSGNSERFSLLTLAVLLLSLFILSLSLDLYRDELTYHLTLPSLYLQNQGFMNMPYFIYSLMPHNLDLLFCLPMSLDNPLLARTTHGIFGLFILFLLTTLLSHKNKKEYGLIAALFFLMNPVVLTEMHLAYTDLALSFFILMAYSILSCRNCEKKSVFPYLLCGISLGLACGVKYTGMTLTLAFLVSFWILEFEDSHSIKSTFRKTLLITLPCLLVFLPWLIKNTWTTGNPLYPFFYSLFGGHNWNSELAGQLENWQQGIGVPLTFKNILLLPFTVILKGGEGYVHFDGKLNPLWILVLPFLFCFISKSKTVRNSLLFSFVYFYTWSFTSQQMRFLIPLLPLLSLSAALSSGFLLESISNPGIKKRLKIFLFLGLSAYVLASSLPLLQTAGRNFPHILIKSDFSSLTPPPIHQYINNHTPLNSRILFLNNNQTFYCQREWLADSFFEASQINDLFKQTGNEAGLVKLLNSLKITHILIRNVDWGISYPEHLKNFLKNNQRCTIVYEWELFSLIQIKPSIQ